MLTKRQSRPAYGVDGHRIVAAVGSILAFAAPAGRYPSKSATELTTSAWTKTGQALRTATELFDAGYRKKS